ncbi:MAG: large subunit ribosomal protein [Desulfovibrionales bacterium]|jgi:large subunit ribosomal protein L3|nr:large subunit ribosomal protein [Desulfovibrionales bacterium]
MAGAKGILGRKLGMTRIFGDDGTIIPVTVVEAGPCPVLQVKTVENDGYEAIQVGFDPIPDRKANKPNRGHQAKAGVGCHRLLREFRGPVEQELGQALTVDMFAAGDKVKVTGTSKGKGFQGAMKRWNFSGQKATHGSEKIHRVPGSVGHCTYPGKVFKGKKMPGHMGAKASTVLNIEVVEVRPEENILLLKGQVPGPKNGYLTVRKIEGR